MSERYSKLFSLPSDLYTEGSPVVITAGALLKDNNTGAVLAQLKIKNVSEKIIKLAHVRLYPFDSLNSPLPGETDKEYLDLLIERDGEFGQKVPIPLPDPSTRAFSAVVTKVGFADNSVWESSDSSWDSLPAPVPLEKALGNAELVKQYKLKCGTDCKNLPLENKDLWYCPCGALNRASETCCHSCGKSLHILKSIDITDLKSERDARLKAEHAAAEEKARQTAVAKEKAEAKAKKVWKILSISLSVFAVAIAAVVLISNSVRKSNLYNDALALMEAGQYEQAINSFTALGGYKDSQEVLSSAQKAKSIEDKYNRAIELMNSNNSQNENEAYQLLLALGEYKDAPALLSDFQYVVISENTDTYERTYEYDSRGLLTEKCYVGGDTTPKIYYDEDGRIIKEINADFPTEFFYNDNGTLSKTIHAQARTSSENFNYLITKYDKNGLPVSIEDELEGKTWAFSYSFKGDGSIETIECTERASYGESSVIINPGEYGVELCHGAKDSILTFKKIEEAGKRETTYGVSIHFKELRLETLRTREFDSYGNEISSVGRKPLRPLENYTCQNSYDDEGNLIQVIKKYTGDGSEVVYHYVYGYIYTPDAI